MINIFDFNKFKGDGTFASVLRDSNDKQIGVCYSKTIKSAIKYFKSNYNLSGEYTMQSHKVYNSTKLSDAVYTEFRVQ